MSDTTNNMTEEKNAPELDDIESLQKKCAEYLDGWQRAKADYSNFKKEQSKKQDELIQFANAALLAELIPVYNNFKKAYAHMPQSEDKEWQNWQAGIGHIKKQMWDFIQKFGITEIKTVGEVFDPHMHESIGTEKTSEFEPGVISKELDPGYLLHGKILMPAKVIIAEAE